MRTLLFGAIASTVCAASTGEAAAGPNEQTAEKIHVYRVGKKVSDLPAGVDLSTPESAYAAINRVVVGQSEATWKDISVARLAKDMKPGKEEKAPPERARPWLEAEILEVHLFRGRVARVISRLAGPDSRPPQFDGRNVELDSGRWLNAGHTIYGTEKEAAEQFAMVCSRMVERPERPPISNPEEHLAPFVEYLKAHGQPPREFILEALARHRLVVIGEIHHRPAYWALNSDVVRDPRFPASCGAVYLELPSNDQNLIGAFLAAERLDTRPVIETLRDNLWMGWPDQAMLDFFIAVWEANRKLPSENRIRIVLVDMPRPWKKIRGPGDWKQYDCDRDQRMAENIIRDLAASTDGRNALFIVGSGHAMEDLRLPVGGSPARTAGWHLCQHLGEQVYSILQHRPVMTNMGHVHGRTNLGLFDSAFAAIGYRPIALPLDGSPFGSQEFDVDPLAAHRGRYRDAFDGYVFMKRLEDESFSALIDGFYTDVFVKELDRRYRLVRGRGLVKGLRLPEANAKSFIGWMERSWGQPRQWTRAMGPLNAWHFGDDWEERIRAEKHRGALQSPDTVRKMAAELFNKIRHADYDKPTSLWNLDYRVDHWYDAWVDWVSKTFRTNPIEEVTLGEVHANEQGRPTIEYVLILKDGRQLSGKLPFEYQPRFQTWEGVTGLDWHLQKAPIREP